FGAVSWPILRAVSAGTAHGRSEITGIQMPVEGNPDGDLTGRIVLRRDAVMAWRSDFVSGSDFVWDAIESRTCARAGVGPGETEPDAGSIEPRRRRRFAGQRPVCGRNQWLGQHSITHVADAVAAAGEVEVRELDRESTE